MNWNEDRHMELGLLTALLHRLGGLESSNHFTANVGRCIEIAAQLSHSDMSTPRASFCEFLNKLAIEDRAKEQV